MPLPAPTHGEKAAALLPAVDSHPSVTDKLLHALVEAVMDNTEATRELATVTARAANIARRMK